jgi:hypothetical protein
MVPVLLIITPSASAPPRSLAVRTMHPRAQSWPTPSAAALDLTPWSWYLEHNMLIEGVAPGAVVLPLVVSATAIAIAGPRFHRPDLT